MWLLNTSTLQLENFYGSAIPKYAILSHTWEDEEVSFQDITKPDLTQTKAKKGFSKIEITCRKARKHEFKYAWVDTCCIDKTSSAELTESINSMFQWYQKAERCYIYLSDLASPTHNMAKCRWFSRGWTLQELIAPKDARFYDMQWKYVGDKSQHSAIIASITGIEEDILIGEAHPKSCSVATRMAWVSRRETTRQEDLVYCLMGIFDVNMPLIYGEGPGAFRRLQEEIIKRSNDLTIFVWEDCYRKGTRSPCDLFAPEPAVFAGCSGIKPFARSPTFAMSNKGLRLDGFGYYKIIQEDSENGTEHTTYSIPLGYRKNASNQLIDFELLIHKVGPDVFVRDGKILRWDSDSNSGRLTRVRMPKLFIHTEIDATHLALPTKELVGLHVPHHADVEIQEVTPESHWEETNRVFFSLDDNKLVIAVSCTINKLNSKIRVVIIVDIGATVPNCRIFNVDDHKSQALSIFRHKRLGHDITWTDIEIDYPELLDCTNSIVVEANGEQMTVRTSIEQGVFDSVSPDEIYALNFTFEKVSGDQLRGDFEDHLEGNLIKHRGDVLEVHAREDREDSIYYETSQYHEIEKILGKRVTAAGHTQYLVCWKDSNPAYDEYKSLKELAHVTPHVTQLINRYKAKQAHLGRLEGNESKRDESNLSYGTSRKKKKPDDDSQSSVTIDRTKPPSPNPSLISRRRSTRKSIRL